MNKFKIITLIFCWLSFCFTGCLKQNNPIIEPNYTGFNTIELNIQNYDGNLSCKRSVVEQENTTFYDTSQWSQDTVFKINGDVVIDSVSISYGELIYKYSLINSKGEVLDSFFTSKNTFPRNLIPQIKLPERPQWDSIYYKAWDLTWQSIVTSDGMPSKYAYNDYPDNRHTTYLWDASFCNLFQRYAQMHNGHPGMKTIDNFYAQQQESGFIARNYRSKDFKPNSMSAEIPKVESINPPLISMCEWEYYQISNDSSRLEQVLPYLVSNFRFIDSFMQEKEGCYLWTGNGSGWDNINWHQGEKAIHYWVDLIPLQALNAFYISNIASVLGENEIKTEFQKEIDRKQQLLDNYWNKEKQWYCSLDKQGEFTRKTLVGMWPMLAGIVSDERAEEIVKTLMNEKTFLTSPMPLPTLAKDESGYNSKGEYWLGSAWINISLMVIQGLEKYGFQAEVSELNIKTLDAIAKTYFDWKENPKTLWEAYAPEFDAPASHKRKKELGSVRKDFSGWTCNLINMIIESHIGIDIDAPKNTITWSILTEEEMGISNLKFNDIITDLLVVPESNGLTFKIQSSGSYWLHIKHKSGVKREIQIKKGDNNFKIEI